MSDTANWSRVRDVFGRALELDPAARPAFVREACGGDAGLLAEVTSLLAAHVDAGSMIEGSPLEALDASAVSSLLHGLRAGDRLGPYDIVGPLGAGGMGQVYEARDRLLGRKVAIKILSAELALDGSARDRLIREAKALAALNHPNIAVIHGVETTKSDASGRPATALVLELIEGQTLAERVARGPLPIADALLVGRQIAGALEAAHEKGIIHRDLKPANIKVAPTGTVKVLDFGLAKATLPDQSAGAVTSMMTERGTVLGTPAYMSPEQVRGDDVDKRTDVWALGCVLFELLTGRRAFGGATASDSLAAVLEREPDWSALPQALPESVRALLRRCLQKDRAKRLRDIGDVRFALEDASLTPEPAGKTQLRMQPWIAFALVALTAGALAAVAVPVVSYLRATAPPAPPETRLEIVTPATDRPKSFALSPDGRQIVYVAQGDGASRLWLRSLATTTAQPLAGTEGASYPFWSPDSRSLGFFSDSNLKRLDLGGAVQTLASVRVGLGGTWNADGVIVFAPSQSTGLLRVSAAGGAVSAVTTLGPRERGHFAPHFLPDGHRFLFFGVGEQVRGTYLGSLDGGAPMLLTPTGESGVYLPTGWLLWIRTGTETLVAQRLDTAKAALTGEPLTVADGVGSVGLHDGVGAISVASTGLVAYRNVQDRQQLIWVDRSGTPRGTLGDPNSILSEPRVSPDGHRVVMTWATPGNTDVWLLDGAHMSRLTSDAASDQRPIWSPDGTRIVFRSNRSGRAGDLYVKRASGAATEELLVASEQIKNPMSWSRDGRFVMYRSLDPQTSSDLWVLPLEGDRKPWPFLNTPAREAQGIFSPDGRWVVYQSNESGRDQIYVRAFVPPGATRSSDEGQLQVTTDGGINPVWGSDGKEVYYLNPAGAMMAAPISVRGSTIESGAPVLLFPTRIVGGGVDALQGRQYDVAADGRFLINTVVDTAVSPITLLMNWHPEAKK
jgi:Tol biopolymer transport system component